MTGFERLRTLAGARDEWGLGGTLAEIADEIERERDAEVADSPYDAILPEDRDALTWVREHGGIDHVRKEWHSRVPHERYEAKRQRLLGHIAECETALGRRREIISELSHRVKALTNENAELRRRAMPEGYEWPRYESGDLVMFGDCVENRNGTCTVNSVRFYSGGGVSVYGEGRGAQFVVVTEPVMHDPIRKARPKVLAADGEPLEVGQTVWHTATGREYTVRDCTNGGAHLSRDGKPAGYCRAEYLTHQRPVLDADGVPIREGETVWDVETGDKYTVDRVFSGTTEPDFPGHTVACRRPDDVVTHMFEPSQLTHERPVLDADGVPIHEGDTVWMTRDSPCDAPLDKGDEVTVRHAYPKVVNVEDETGESWIVYSGHLTHERPDSWERVEEDCAKADVDYCDERGLLDTSCNKDEGDGSSRHCTDCGCTCGEKMARDLVRRCRALAERERGE